MSLLTFMERKAYGKILGNCPKCGNADIYYAISGNCMKCGSPVQTKDEKLTLQYAIEIIKEFTEKYDDNNPPQAKEFVISFFAQLIEQLKNNTMPTNSEIVKLQSLFMKGSLGGKKFGGFLKIENGKPTNITVNKDAPNAHDIEMSLGAVTFSILYIRNLTGEAHSGKRRGIFGKLFRSRQSR